MSEKTIVEINGVKLEVDLRTAKRIDTIRVGDKVKILDSSGYGSPVVHNGVVVGFEPFEKLPTIVVAYTNGGWGNSPEIKFLYYNSKSEKYELIISNDDVMLDKENAIEAFDRKEKKLLADLDELRAVRSYFERNFKSYWEPYKGEV